MSTTSAHQSPTSLIGEPAAGLSDGGHDAVVRRDAAVGAADVDRADPAGTYTAVPTRRVAAVNGIVYAYRHIGESDVPVVLLQHFRGNLDNWDPALVDDLAARRRVIAFDNVGVAATSGTTPSTVEDMARAAPSTSSTRLTATGSTSSGSPSAASLHKR